MGQNYHLCPPSVSPMHGTDGASGQEVQFLRLKYKTQTGRNGKKEKRKKELMRDDLPFRMWRLSASVQGHPFLSRESKHTQGSCQETVNVAEHPNTPKCWALVIRSGSWVTSELFGQCMAPFFMQAAGYCPEKLSEVSFPGHGHPTLPLSGTSTGARKVCDGDLTSHPGEHWAESCPRRWWSPLLLSVHPFQTAICVPHLPFPSCIDPFV